MTAWRLSTLVTTALVASSMVSTARADLAGVWKREDGGVLQVTHHNNTIKMTHLEVTPAVHKEFGFNPGDEHVIATVDGSSVRGKMHVHLPSSWKTICPDQWDHWSPIELTLSDDGRKLTGRWQRSFFDDKTCNVLRTEWIPREYVKGTASSSLESGSLQAITSGKPLVITSFELILDASGSMWGAVGGRPKIDIAKETMRQVIASLPDGVEVALRVYGHRVAAGQPGACQDSELIFPLRKIEKRRLVEQIDAIRALGTTPIAYSLDQVAADVGDRNADTMVILITDGKEECGGSPSRAISRLIASGLQLHVNIVGFALAGEAAKSEMRRAAELTGGRFFDAASGRALRDSIERALAIPYDVLNRAGRIIADGLVGQDAVEVPEGTYTVVINVSGKPITVRDVRVSSGKRTTLELKETDQKINARVVQSK